MVEGIDRHHLHLVNIIDRPDRVLVVVLPMDTERHPRHPRHLAGIIDHRVRRIMTTDTIIIITIPLVVSGLLLRLV